MRLLAKVTIKFGPVGVLSQLSEVAGCDTTHKQLGPPTVWGVSLSRSTDLHGFLVQFALLTSSPSPHPSGSKATLGSLLRGSVSCLIYLDHHTQPTRACSRRISPPLPPPHFMQNGSGVTSSTVNTAACMTFHNIASEAVPAHVWHF